MAQYEDYKDILGGSLIKGYLELGKKEGYCSGLNVGFRSLGFQVRGIF